MGAEYVGDCVCDGRSVALTRPPAAAATPTASTVAARPAACRAAVAAIAGAAVGGRRDLRTERVRDECECHESETTRTVRERSELRSIYKPNARELQSGSARPRALDRFQSLTCKMVIICSGRYFAVLKYCTSSLFLNGLTRMSTLVSGLVPDARYELL